MSLLVTKPFSSLSAKWKSCSARDFTSVYPSAMVYVQSNVFAINLTVRRKVKYLVANRAPN